MERTGTRNMVIVLGYALLLAVNATSIWGGVFPFFPEEFQTDMVTTTFYLAQALTFCGTFVVALTVSYRQDNAARFPRTSLVLTPWLAGSFCLVLAMYLPNLTLLLVVTAGLLQGTGAALALCSWQACFASKSVDRGGLLMVFGTATATLVYLLLHLVPEAVTAFLIPLVLIPLCGLCLSLSRRSMDTSQPMFTEPTREHARVYQHVARTYWKPALCIGALGFSSGIVRALALYHSNVGDVVNIASMVGALLGAVVLIGFWNRHSFSFNIYGIFRLLLPALLTAFLLLPFLGADYLGVFAAFAYLLFSFATMLMGIQCIQISHNHGVRPTFAFALFAAVVYLLQALGFIFGHFAETVSIVGLQPLSIVALGSVWLLAMILIAAERNPLRAVPIPQTELASTIEFIAIHDRRADKPSAHRGSQAHNDPLAPPIRDRLSKRCLMAKETYGLTVRETEIAEYIARGVTVNVIAEKLVISENTVRAHSKHIYTKLGIHKRQELLDLLETM